jgi:hypothetical protein
LGLDVGALRKQSLLSRRYVAAATVKPLGFEEL